MSAPARRQPHDPETTDHETCSTLEHRFSTASTVWSVDHAVVVGTGLGGLTASLILSRVAARVTLVERAERPSEVGAALALQPNGMAVLDRLGLLSAVEAVSARIDRMDIRSVTGRRLLTAEMPDLGRGLDHAIAVRRTDLHRLLLDAVAGVASIDTRFGWTAVSADPSGAVAIRPTAKNGPDLGSTSLRADVIVGADGVNSAVRTTGGFQSRVSPGSSYARAIVSGRASPWFEEHWTPLGSFGQAPLGGDLVYFWAAAHVAAAADAVSRRRPWSLPLGVATGTSGRRGPVGEGVVLRRPADQYRPPSRLSALVLRPPGFARRRSPRHAPERGPRSKQRFGRRRRPSGGTSQRRIGEERPGGIRQAPASTRPARAKDGGDAATPLWHPAGPGSARKGCPAGRIGPVPAAQ
jgi:2-polyprenyl-6-methoxyphenol hydroxylase-like FAD-dependent oxidoreductase